MESMQRSGPSKVFSLVVTQGGVARDAGVYLNTAEATAGDYLAFVGDLVSAIQRMAATDLEAQANAQGRTLASGLAGVGSVGKVADEARDVGV